MLIINNNVITIIIEVKVKLTFLINVFGNNSRRILKYNNVLLKLFLIIWNS